VTAGFLSKKEGTKKRKRGVGISVLLMTGACRLNRAAFLLGQKNRRREAEKWAQKTVFLTDLGVRSPLALALSP
jgi:hypothetical protein